MSETKAKFGIGFRPQHYAWVTTQYPREVDFFEIVSENFMGVGGRPRTFLEKLRENYPITMHGVALSIGSKGSLNRRYLEELRKLVQYVRPTIVSDHLSWAQHGQRNSHDLLPITYTQESLDDIVAKLGYIQDFLGQRFYLENPSAYVAFQDADYDEAGFFAELLKRSGAGILLDINNLYVNQRNLNLDPMDYLRSLRPEDVGYFHLAGHSDQGEVLVDTHDQPVPDSVWALYGKTLDYFPNVPTLVEWDGNIPEFPRLLEECNKARNYRAEHRANKLPGLVPEIPSQKTTNNLRNYSKFFDQIIRPYGISEDGTSNLRKDLPVPAMVGLKVYNHAYFLRLEEVLSDTFQGLLYITEEEGFRYIVAAFVENCPPRHPNIRTVGEDLATFLKDPATDIDYDFGVPLTLLGDLAALEYARSQVFSAENAPLATVESLMAFSADDWEQSSFSASPSLRLVSCDFDVLPTLSAIDREETPDIPEAKPARYAVSRQGFSIVEESLSPEEFQVLEAFSRGATLEEAGRVLPGPVEEHISFVATKLMEWTQKGWFTEVRKAD